MGVLLMGIRVVSVPHTGTHTVRKLARKMGHPRGIDGCHTQSEKMGHIWNYHQDGHTILIPRRDPVATYISFYQRVPEHPDLTKHVLEFYMWMRWVRAAIPHYVIINVDKGPPTLDYLKMCVEFPDEHDERIKEFLAEWPKLGKASYHHPTPSIPQEIEDLRAEWGYR